MLIRTEQDLVTLIATGVQESLNLDYKRSDALQNDDKHKNEVSKDVSAFANSAGGTLVYGMIEVKHLPTALDHGFDPNVISREWLENVINSRIQPRIQNVGINSVPLASVSPGRVVYVVEVPQSHTAHQAFDKRYYKRFNFQSVPMEDYELRDVLGRAKTPLLVPNFKAHRLQRADGLFHYHLAVTMHNQGDVAARSIKFAFALPEQLIHQNAPGYGVTTRQNTLGPGPYNERVFVAHSPTNHILFPDDEISLGDWGFGGPIVHMDTTLYKFILETRAALTWTVFADDMRRQTGQILLRDLLNY